MRRDAPRFAALSGGGTGALRHAPLAPLVGREGGLLVAAAEEGGGGGVEPEGGGLAMFRADGERVRGTCRASTAHPPHES